MDGLMSEATDLILSNNQNFTIDLNKAFNLERRKSLPDLTDVSSISLLRMSITKSLKDRRSQSEVIDSTAPKRRKSKRRQNSYPGKPKVNVEFLDSEIETANNKDTSVEEQNKLDVPEDVLTNLFTEESNQDETLKPQFEINQAEYNENITSKNDSPNGKKEAIQSNPIGNVLKLAQRHYPDNIFENCSTYSLTCPEVIPKRTTNSSSEEHASDIFVFFNNKTSKSDSDLVDDDHKNNNTDNDNAEDQISLRDSFFVNVNSDDNLSDNSFFSKGSDDFGTSRRSSKVSMSKENKETVCDEIKSDFDSEKLQQKSERKLSKKERKRQKRSKSNAVTTYDCPKCGISYILSNSASRSTACCLHCDFWKSVEPVFQKREKQPWNTCRIC